jgi:DNA-directed RNA polymerase specialized sigma24 family protein
MEQAKPFANRLGNGIVTGDDLLQEAACTALKYLENNELPDFPDKWFMTLVRYARNKITRREQSVDAEAPEQSYNPYPSIDIRLDAEELISKLKPADRDLATKYYLEGKSLSELPGNTGTNKNKLVKIKNRLRELACEPSN